MSIPAIIIIALAFMDLGYYIAKHGQSRGNFYWPAKVVDMGVLLGLLYWGGFFN